MVTKHINEMRSLLGADGALPEKKILAMMQPFSHSHAKESCANVSRSDTRLRSLVEELYAVDYECLGYPASKR